MASAVFENRTESSLGKFMGKKLNYSSPNSTNPNPNRKHSKPKKKQFHQLDVPIVSQDASDDAYSYNQRGFNGNHAKREGEGFNCVDYVNIRFSGCSKSELNELRRKLELELQKVRSLNDRIQFGGFSGKNTKLSGQKRPFTGVMNVDRGEFEGLMKMCKQILTKLMRNRNSRVFNKPVDADGLGLYDYHQIVKEPMDLGTVKINLAKNLYSSPGEFASDVRLTFNNAMVYNPKTDQVHSMAAQLLSQFEDMFGPVQEKLESSVEKEDVVRVGNDDWHGSSWNEIGTPERPKKPKTNLVSSVPTVKPERIPERIPEPLVQSSASNRSNSDPRSMQSPVLTPSPVRAQPVKPTGSVKGVSTSKQPKPKAKDPNKRAMTMEEKQKLGVGLQNLPEEKMPQLVQIIRKRNERLAQEGDEIELDIEALDTETLWELDRFVTNWKKLASKTKRQALMENFSTAPMVAPDTDEAVASDMNDGAEKIKKGDGDEDVDIGDEMPESSFLPVEIEKEEGANFRDNGNMNGNGNASSSSSSSGSSSSDSSSSDSDSGSRSGSDSDADAEDEVQS
ncbi:Transcription factor GTE2 [Heracleum sosnowskyi]|uniref:Transcription factor GTE2 n=1 Tax=Heracleum sosnowskyi TaxID=360622 RepID=A0AAD8H3S6_9APIA|nr:Transcription factor GTE2 [Heracleum sosnowskyi]